ncbi:MAG TPA: sigma-54 dependent transcriptional regulator, partial [Candidatus Paceibacterota bacterium]|nr:sigma-54 dependent transcriptional regulator [Candidatus Paceibacterota bacterium]
LETCHVHLVITDLMMPQSSGMDLVQHIRENCRGTGVMMITGYPSIRGAVDAIQTGAEEFLPKPFTDEELVLAVRKTLQKMKSHCLRHPEPAQPTPAQSGLIGTSEPMRQVFTAIKRTASTSATVLLTGESGTGKELVARAIHYGSARASAAFVPVNCGGIPEGLLESELFGHMKGAFTGATESRAGLFHAADGGTIFLDEVSEMSLSMQVKLLRAIQEKEVCMVGSTRTRKVDVRILAATNKNLADLVKKGAFREDLFYRLNVITIILPPLRERGEDISLLVQHFAERYSIEACRPALRFSERALRILLNYNWPGNVRELENVIQRLAVMNEGDLVEAPDLPQLMRFSALRKTSLTRTLAEMDRDYIKDVLQSVGGNKTKASEILGIDRKTLRLRLKEC